MPPPNRQNRRVTLLVVLVVLAAGWGVYSRVAGYDFIPLDDPGYVYEHQALQQGLSLAGVRWAFGSLEAANWHPLTWLSLMADYQVYGLNAGGYHLTNVLLHLAASVLLFLWLLQATGRRWASAGVGLLFCLSPAHVESVAWVSERKDVLSSVCFLWVLMAYTRYGRTGSRWAYGGALGALGLGLLAKPMLVTVPGVLLLLDGWPLGRLRTRKELRGLLVEKVPFALLAAASCVVTFIAQHRAGATASLENLPLFLRVASALTTYAVYMGKLFWPVDLAVFYPYWTSLPVLQAAVGATGLIVATWIAVRLRRSKPYVLVGWLWFVGTLVPVIGLVQVGSQAMADRYTYLPSIGLFVVLCWSVDDLWRSRPRQRPLLAAGCVAALALSAALCYRQVGYWQNGATLFEHSLAVTRPNVRAYSLLGDAYLRLNLFAPAEANYRKAFRLKPDEKEQVLKLGYLEMQQQHWERACRWLGQLAARRTCTDAVLYNDLGYALLQLGRTEEACAALRRSLQLSPDDPVARNNLDDALRASGQPNGAAGTGVTVVGSGH